MEKKERKPNGYWNIKENCLDEARKYKYKQQFRKCSNKAYVSCLNNGWIDEIDWFEPPVLTRKWTYELVAKEVSKYQTRGDFRKKSAKAYQAAVRNRWIWDFFPKNKKSPVPIGWWMIKEHCIEEARKYKSRADFSKGTSAAYRSCIENGWIDECDWLKNNMHEGDDYWIYAYEDIENKVVYVGLTWRKERHTEHKRDKSDGANKYFKSIGKLLPEPMIKMDGLSAEDAQYYEDWYKKAYAKNGWKVLNKAKTGVGSSSIGGSAVKWDKNACEEEAKKYKTKTEYRKGNASAYNVAVKNKWINEWFCDKINHWTYDSCKKEAEKYEIVSDFMIESPCAYRVAKKNGWLKDFYWLKKRQVHNKKWNYETCKIEASKYCTRSKFCLGNGSAYDVSRKNGWLDMFFPKAA